MEKSSKRFCPKTPVYQVNIPAFTYDELVQICNASRCISVDEYCLDKESGKYVVKGTFINNLLRRFIEDLYAANPEFPISKAHYISPSYRTTRDEPIYIDQELVFYIQVNSEGNSFGVKQATCIFEIRRASDDVLVFGGVGTFDEKLN